MNFLGHVHFARRVRDEPRFVLGAMLPDLSNMAGVRLAPQDEPAIAAGVRDHHTVDDAFHVAPTFCALQGEAYRELSARGLGWGSARAVAHVATELFLDGVLAGDAATGESYLRAVAVGRQDETRALVRLGRGASEAADRGAGQRLAALFARMAPHGPPTRYRDPRFVREVMVRILEHRPRLALAAGDVPALDAYLPTLRAAVERSTDTLLAEVTAALARP